MTFGYRCDRCEDWYEGEPYQALDEKNSYVEETWFPGVEHDYHLCEGCWNDFGKFVCGGGA